MQYLFFLFFLLFFSSCSQTQPPQNSTYLIEIQNTKQSLMARDYSNQALFYKKEKRYKEALLLNKKSLAIHLHEKPINQEALSINYDTMGVLYHILGQDDLAVKYLKKSLSIREEYFSKNDRFLGDSYNNLAVVFESIGNHKEALKYFKKSLAIRQKVLGKNHQDTSLTYSAMGSVYEQLHQYDKAIDYHAKAIEILEKKEPSEALATAYGGIATLHLREHAYQKALRLYEKILSIRTSLDKRESLRLANSYNNLGVTWMKLENFQKSKAYLEKAIRIKKSILGEESNALQQEYLNMGWLYYYTKAYKKAYPYVLDSFEMLLKQRDNYFATLDALENQHYLQNNQEAVNLLLQLTHELGDVKTFKKSFSLWLRYKGTTFKNQNRILALSFNNSTPELKEKAELFKQEQRKLAKLYASKVSSKKEYILKEEIKASELKIRELKEELFSHSQKEKVGFEALTQKLKENELYVDFAKVGKHYFGFAIKRDGEIFFKRTSVENSQKIDRAVLSFRAKMKRSLQGQKVESKEELSQLYRLVIRTLVEVLAKDKTKLIISPDGLLNLLPFETLYVENEGKFLIEKRDIEYIPSGRELVYLRDLSPESNSQKVVLFANPAFDNTIEEGKLRGSNERLFNLKFSTLKGTEDEVKIISSLLKNSKVERYEREEATEENLFNVVKPKILHIATHGFFIKSELKNPMLNAGIALSGANTSIKKGYDYGVVTALKLSGLNLKGTELVVLSACETALVSPNSTESVGVLSKAFIQAGAKGVVASLWSVSDKGTRDLMANFYEQIAKNEGYSKALKKAKVKMIKEGVSPSVWSAFVFNGVEE